MSIQTNSDNKSTAVEAKPQQKELEATRDDLIQRVVVADLLPSEAAEIYANKLAVVWTPEAAADALAGYDTFAYACEEIDRGYQDGDGIGELFDWLEDNGQSVN